MGGNEKFNFSSEEVVSVYEFTPKVQNREWHLDASRVSIVTGSIDFTLSSVPEYMNLDENKMTPFEDIVPPYPRGYPVSVSSYGIELLDAVSDLPPQQTTYISRKQKTATCGFVYDNTPEGTDSIAYGGLLY